MKQNCFTSCFGCIAAPFRALGWILGVLFGGCCLVGALILVFVLETAATGFGVICVFPLTLFVAGVLLLYFRKDVKEAAHKLASERAADVTVLILGALLGSMLLSATPALAAGMPGENATVEVSVNSDGTIKLVADKPELYVQGDEIANQTLKGKAVGAKWEYTLKKTAKAFEIKYAKAFSFPDGLCKIVAGTTWVQCDVAKAKPAAKLATRPTTGEYDLCPAGQWCDGGMWHVVIAEKRMYHTGGTSWTHVNFNEEAKKLLLDGYTAVFTITVRGEARACRSYWNGADSDGNVMTQLVPGDCSKFWLRPGTYEVNGWAWDPECGVQVGFRVVPEDAADWKETPTCDNCDDWARIEPVYASTVVNVVVTDPEITGPNPGPTPEVGFLRGLWYAILNGLAGIWNAIKAVWYAIW